MEALLTFSACTVGTFAALSNKWTYHSFERGTFGVQAQTLVHSGGDFEETTVSDSFFKLVSWWIDVKDQFQKDLLTKSYQKWNQNHSINFPQRFADKNEIKITVLIFHKNVGFELNNYKCHRSHRVQDAENNRSVNGDKSRGIKFGSVVKNRSSKVVAFVQDQIRLKALR